MTLQTRRLTYEEYLKGPEIKGRYDIVDGVTITAPTPTLNHQKILRQLFLQVYGFVAERQMGEVLFAPLDIVVQREPLRTRQPDLLFVSNERADILGPIIEGAPDLVAEILSPSNSRADVEAKLADYAGLGVRECWLVSSEARSVEVLGLTENDWSRVAMCGLGDEVQTQVLAGLVLPVSELFG
jgi:Uma2 family endonuclease